MGLRFLETSLVTSFQQVHSCMTTFSSQLLRPFLTFYADSVWHTTSTVSMLRVSKQKLCLWVLLVPGLGCESASRQLHDWRCSPVRIRAIQHVLYVYIHRACQLYQTYEKVHQKPLHTRSDWRVYSSGDITRIILSRALLCQAAQTEEERVG